MKHFVLGYASLMERESRLRTNALADEIFPVYVREYVRGWWARTGVPGLSATFLGCLNAAKFADIEVQRTEAGMNGVVYSVKEAAAMAAVEKEKDEEITEAQQDFEARYKAIKEEADSRDAVAAVEESIPLIQEEKMVYIKYLYIRAKDAGPAYTKYINRIGEPLDIYSEYYYVRFNKFSKARNNITIRDRSSGVVDLTLIYPWKRLTLLEIQSTPGEGTAVTCTVRPEALRGGKREERRPSPGEDSSPEGGAAGSSPGAPGCPVH